MKQLLRHGTIYDGTGSAPLVGDILLEDDRILQIAPSIECPEAQVIDLTGLSVAPGFVDGHSHNDWFAMKKAPLKYFDPFIRQGITTFVTGNCGISAFGFDDNPRNLEQMGAGLFGYHGEELGVFPRLKDYLEAIDGHTPCNIAALMGHCTARAAVAGFENRELTEAESAHMLELLEQGLQDGACGVSLGLMYVPGLYAHEAELRKVALLCEKYDVPMTVHPRAESKVSMAYPQLLGRSHLLRAMDELHEIARSTHLKLQYSHAIFVGRQTIPDKPELLKLMDRMRSEGIDVRFDIYNETKGTSVITVVLPDWYQAMTPAEKRKPFNKLKLAVLCAATIKLLGFGWNDIEIAWVGEGNERWMGKTVAQIAKEMGKSNLDAYLDLCEMSRFKGRVNMGPYSTPEIISDFEKNELCTFMTDAWVEEYGVQNPAIYDCHPKFLRDALLGTGADLSTTVRKMTGAVADRFQLPERGYLKPGYYADVTVFNEAAIKAATPDQERSFGIEKVWINGRLVLDGDRLDTDALKTTGRAVRRG